MPGKRRFGSIRQRASGRYQARYRGPDGIVHSASTTFVRKKDAELWLQKVELDIFRGEWTNPDGGAVSFSEYARKWVAERPNLRPRTVTLYSTMLRRHLEPTFGQMPVSSITYANVRSWRQGRLDAGLGAVTVAKAYRLLQAILNTAVEDELVRRNPCRIKGAGVERSAERPVATIEEVYAIADEIETRYRALVLLATFASLRWGELIALRRPDLDLDALTVAVDKAYSEDRGRFILGPPKSAAGKRVVTIPEVIAPDLDSHLRRFAEKGKTGRVFVGPKGATPRRTNFQKYWRRALAAAGIDESLHLHDLRHTGNTLSAHTGASLRELMARAGHSSSQAALGYLHTVEERNRAIAEGLSDLVKKSRQQGQKRKSQERRKHDAG